MHIGPLFPNLSNEVQAALGRYVSTFANLEYYLAYGTWAFFDRYDDGPGMNRTARKNGTRLLALYSKHFDLLVEEACGTAYEPEARTLSARFSKLKAELDACIEERNKIVHAAWIRGDGSAYQFVEIQQKRFAMAMLQLDHQTLDVMTTKVAELSGAMLQFVALVRDGFLVRVRDKHPPATLRETPSG